MWGLATSMAIRNQEMLMRYQPQAVQSFAGNQGGLSSNTKFKGWDGKEGLNAAAGKGSKGDRQQSPFFSGLAVNSKGDVKMPLPAFLAAVLQPLTPTLQTFWQRFGATQLAAAEAPKSTKREWIG